MSFEMSSALCACTAAPNWLAMLRGDDPFGLVTSNAYSVELELGAARRDCAK